MQSDQRTFSRRCARIAAAVAAMLCTSAFAQAVPPLIDLSYSGDLMGLIPQLRSIDQTLSVTKSGPDQQVPINVLAARLPMTEVLRQVGEQTGDRADIVYSQKKNALRIDFKAPATPIVLTPPRKPVQRNADGAVRIAFGEARAKLTCALEDVCAIELEHGERIIRLDVGDKTHWEVSPSMVGEGDSRAMVIIVRSTAPKANTRLVVSTNRRIYSIALTTAGPDAESDSRLFFTYPSASNG